MRPLALGKLHIVKVRGADVLVEAIASATGLSTRAIRNRVTRSHGRSLVRTAFDDHWPSRLQELGAEPAGKLTQEPGLVAELARLIDVDVTTATNRLGAASKKTTLAALRDLWPDTAPSSPADVLDMSVQQARGRGDLTTFARILRVEPTFFARRIKRAHGAVLIRNAVADLLPNVPVSSDAKLLFGSYELTGLKWKGGFALVREAWNRRARPHRLVVLKRPLRGAQATKALLDEYKRARDLRHPNLVGYSAIEEEADGTPVLVIDHGGQALGPLLDRKRRSIQEALALCRQVASALDYLGENNLAHLDLHPGNILVDGAGVARLTDFGISRRLAGPAGRTVATSTVVGHFPDFAAPEVERGTASRASDQYSLALVFLSCVCGVDGAIDCVDRNEFPSALTNAQIAAFWKARNESPARRFRSSSAFVDELEHQTNEG